MVRILIADDHRLMREGLRVLFERQHGYSIVAEAEDGMEAVRLTLEHRPDVVLMDIGMPCMNGIEATRRIHEKVPESKVLVLSMYTDRQFAQNMFRVGAAGYVLKGASFEELLEAVTSVTSGRRYISHSVKEMLLDDYIDNLSQYLQGEKDPLTSREREVLQLLAEGKSNKEIAAILYVTVNTIDAHRKHISDKLGLKSIAELTKYAISHGITSVETRS
jgi:DNA-binding NarL/FixJ family response regulator